MQYTLLVIKIEDFPAHRRIQFEQKMFDKNDSLSTSHDLHSKKWQLFHFWAGLRSATFLKQIPNLYQN